MKLDRDIFDVLTHQLQNQGEVPHWCLASSATIRAIAGVEAECFGPRGRWFHRLFNRLGLSMASCFSLMLIGCAVSSVWWFRCLTAARIEQDAQELFIGFGAGPERQMLTRFMLETDARVAHLNQTAPKSLGLVARPGLFNMFKNCFCDAWILVRSLRKARNPVIRENSGKWLVSAAIRFSDYVFFKSWVEALPVRVEGLVFVSADIPAFAALDARNTGRFRIEYRQHGLLKKSMIFPRFSRVFALNRHEAAHLKKRIPAARVDFPESATSERHKGRPSSILLFASIYDSGTFRKHDYVQVLRNVFAWAADKGLRIIVRPHPCESGKFWKGHFPEMPHDETTGGFQDALRHYKPLFVASWWSTSLLDALRAGMAPVLIVNGSESALEDMVYPLRNVTFHWDRDESLLTEMIANRAIYRDRVMNLLQFV